MILENRKIISITVFFVTLIIINSSVLAKNVMELHKGTVKLIRNEKSQILDRVGEEFSLLAGDRLQTGSNTNVTLFLKGKEKTIKLFSNSFFKLEELNTDGDSVSLLTGKGNFNITPLDNLASDIQKVDSKIDDKKDNNEEEFEGKFSGKFEKLSKSKILRRKKRFSIRTVSAIVGVRGTEFVVGTEEGSTKVLGLSGEVTFASPEVPNYEIPVQANQASHVNEGSGPSVPVNVPNSEREKIVAGEAANVFSEVEFGPSELVSTIQQRLQNEDDTPRFEEEQDGEGRFFEQLDRLEELESLVENAENAIYSSTQKILVLSVTFTNR